MFGIKNKDLFMIGIILGIALFFIGAMISNVFVDDSQNLEASAGYKAQFFVKMLGYGFLVSSMIISGIILDDIDKSIKLLMLVFGLILLLAFTAGVQTLQWNASSAESAMGVRPTGYGTPGFEMVFLIIASIVAFFTHKKIKQNK